MEPSSAQSQNQLAIVIIIAVAVGFVIASALVIYEYELYMGGTDIYPTWKGAELFWQDGLSPYDEQIGRESQQAIYADGVADEGEDEFQFVYPFYMILYIGPLFLAEFSIAATILMEIMLLLLGGTLFLALDTLQWLPKPPTLGVALLIFLTAYFSVRGMLLLQPAFLAYGFHIAAYWSISRRYDHVAGVLLALSTIKPQTGYLLVPLLLLWAWFNHRRQIVWGFVAMFAALFAVSFALLPTWFFEWIDRVFGYRNYTETIATVQIVTHAVDAVPNLAQFVAQLVISVMVLVPVFRFWQQAIVNQRNANFFWGIMLTMTASLLVAPRTATTYYVELYPVLLVILFALEQRRQTLLLIGGSLVFVASYWALHIATAPPIEEAGREAPIVYVVFPTLIYVYLLWHRNFWQQIDILHREPASQPSISEASAL
jgi:hypothetical protein